MSVDSTKVCPEEIRELIERWSISKTLLAEMMGMARSTFANKYRTDYYIHFTEEEIFRLKEVLQELGRDIDEVVR